MGPRGYSCPHLGGCGSGVSLNENIKDKSHLVNHFSRTAELRAAFAPCGTCGKVQCPEIVTM